MVGTRMGRWGTACLAIAAGFAYVAPASVSIGSMIGHSAFHFVEQARSHARWAGTHDITLAARALQSAATAIDQSLLPATVHTHGPGSAPHSHSSAVDALLVVAGSDAGSLTAAPSSPPPVGGHVPAAEHSWTAMGQWLATSTIAADSPPAIWSAAPPPPPPRKTPV